MDLDSVCKPDAFCELKSELLLSFQNVDPAVWLGSFSAHGLMSILGLVGLPLIIYLNPILFLFFYARNY